MPVQLSGQPLTIERATAWLTPGKLSFAPPGLLGYFLQGCDDKYDAYQQDRFLADLKAIITPAVAEGRSIAAPSANVLALRDRYQNTELQKKLNEWNAAGRNNGRVSITFVPLSLGVPGLPNIDTTKSMLVPQYHAGISAEGATNLYTDGFVGCTGVLVTPTAAGTKGAILVHVAQEGGALKEDFTDYLLKNIKVVLDLASERYRWVATGVDITLLVGEVETESGNILKPDLPAAIQTAYAHGGVRFVQDLRLFRERAGQFFFNSEQKTLCLLQGNPLPESKWQMANYVGWVKALSLGKTTPPDMEWEPMRQLLDMVRALSVAKQSPPDKTRETMTGLAGAMRVMGAKKETRQGVGGNGRHGRDD